MSDPIKPPEEPKKSFWKGLWSTVTDTLSGRKTYISSVLLIGWGVFEIVHGDVMGGGSHILEAVGISALRAGVAKSQ